MFDLFVQKVRSAFTSPESRNRILVTLGVIAVFRFLSAIPLPGVNPQVLTDIFSSSPVLTIFSNISGGNFDSPTLASMGLASYISASILMQLLQTIIPKLDDLSKEGARGRTVINQITRIITIPLSIIQSILLYYIVISLSNTQIIGDFSRSTILALILAFTASTIFLMWLAETITASGIGIGSTIIILVGILSNLPAVIPQDFSNFISNGQINFLIAFFIVMLLMFFLVVLFTEAVRKIPIKYSSRIRSSDNSSLPTAESSFFPIKPNMIGVMPVIFASMLTIAPNFLTGYILQALSTQPERKLYIVSKWLQDNIYAQSAILNYLLIEVVFIILFSFVYTYIQFKPAEVADNLKKSGAFIPGIRPGEYTASYINTVLIRMTVIGTFFLCIVAVAPSLMSFASRFFTGITFSTFSFIGGTSLLIVVAGLLEVFRQLSAIKNVQSYDIDE